MSSGNPSAPPSRPITTNARAFQHPDRPQPGQAQNGGQQPPNPRAVQQLKPQELKRHSASNIQVSNRQRGNPVLKEIKSHAYELGDLSADYVLGATTCALYLSLKYHRLHPHYIYSRIKELAGKYALRILLVMVDVTAHEEHVKELSKTCLINNFTMILCWSAAEAGRYLELYKTYEHAPATSIKGHVSHAHGDKLVEFITTPRSINKTDAMSLVGNFGSVRTAVNARPEELLMIAGWGPTKVKQWHAAATEPFRTKQSMKQSAKRALVATQAVPSLAEAAAIGVDPIERSEISTSHAAAADLPDADQRPPKRAADDAFDVEDEVVAREVVNAGNAIPTPRIQPPPGTENAATKPRSKPPEPEVSDGIMAALARLRQGG